MNTSIVCVVCYSGIDAISVDTPPVNTINSG